MGSTLARRSLPVARAAVAALLSTFLAGGAARAAESRGSAPGEALERGGADPALAETGPHVTLTWFDVEGRLDSRFSDVTRAVSAIFRDAGVRVAWEHGEAGVMSAASGASGGPKLPVVIMSRPPASLDPTVLGLVPRSGARGIWVFVDNVRRTLGQSPERPLAGYELAAASEGVARVVAHELVHALAPQEPHARDGLMRSCFTHADLQGPRPRLRAEYADAVRAALAPSRPLAKVRPALAADFALRH
jgi:hypothetical protein